MIRLNILGESLAGSFKIQPSLHLLLHLLQSGPQGAATANAVTVALHTGGVMCLG